MTALTLLLAALALIGLTVLVLLRKMADPGTVSECDPDWVNNFAVTKYRPMLRLLDDADYEFLSKQRGFTKQMIRRLRAERREIFRGYLHNLVRDFHRLHMAARMLLIYSPQDRPDLAAALLKQRCRFAFAVFAVEVRLAFHTVGVGSVDVRQVLNVVESLRTNVGQLPAFQQAAI